jgi:hypothetical protein
LDHCDSGAVCPKDTLTFGRRIPSPIAATAPRPKAFINAVDVNPDFAIEVSAEDNTRDTWGIFFGS